MSHATVSTSARALAATAARRVAAIAAVVAVITAVLALPAFAHVTINPKTAEQGGFAKVAFRVPNERDNASTVKVEVEFPTDHPLAFVSVRPVPGWTVEVTESKLDTPVPMEGSELTEAVTKITWSGGTIEPGQFQEFEVSMGRMPTDVEQLVFPATQTYSNGEVVKWHDRPSADGSEVEHPAPVLTLVPAAENGDGHGAVTATATPTPATEMAPAAETAPAGAAASDSLARILGVAGIAVGLAGTVVGVAGLRRRSGEGRSAPPPAA